MYTTTKARSCKGESVVSTIGIEYKKLNESNKKESWKELNPKLI